LSALLSQLERYIRSNRGFVSLTTMAPSRWRILEGKSAAITGGTTGIGRAIALEYLRQGCNVAINHLGLERDEVHKDSLLKEAAVLKAEKVEGESTSKAGDLLEVVGDVTKAETGELLVQKAVEKWGKLDIFVANAGIFQAADFLT
jgi:L-rhamnose 1-dehydrogenase